MTEFKIGFFVSSRTQPTVEKYMQKYELKMKPRVEERGEKTYLEFKGEFYDLFKLYREKRPWHKMVSCFDVPTDIPVWFDDDDLRRFYRVELLDVLKDPPQDLEKYLSSPSPKSHKLHRTEIQSRDYAVVKGSVHNVFNVMSNIRDDTSENPFETQKHYEQICRTYRLPALPLFITHLVRN